MPVIKHRMRHHPLNPETEILIIGTFNPDTPANQADFFYGRPQNYLWRLLPTAFGEEDLKQAEKSTKMDFLRRRKIDLIDVIQEVKVEAGQETNYMDSYLDKQEITWRNVIREIEKLPQLKKVCFTRKSFSDIPHIRNEIQQIEQFCKEKGIYFQALTTPARIYSEDKQKEWTDFLLAEIGNSL